MTRCLMALPLVLALPHAAAAQAPGPYLQSGLLVMRQMEGVPNHRVRPPFRGAGIGVPAAFGYWVNRELAIEGAFLYARASTDQTFSYTWREEYTLEIRDLVTHGAVRWTPPGLSPVEFVLSGGPTFMRTRRHSGTLYRMFPPGATEPMPDWVETRVILSATAGVDVRLRAGRAVDLVPGLRWRWSARPEHLDYYGVGWRALEFGLGVRVRP
jgi:hypothetical protein